MLSILSLAFLTGCGPTYPKEKIPEAIADLCKKEYKLEVSAKVAGNTVAVYLPVANLFDAVLNLDKDASKKINDVILGVSRVSLSTDAKFDFYIVFAQDPVMPEIEIVYIRYVEDVKKFLWGGLSREEYARRAVIGIKTPPQAERERILKELFAKLNIKDGDEMIQEYLGAEEEVSGIGEISYWDNKFFIKEINLSEFLASQITERIRMSFRQDRDINKWFELKSNDGKFIREGPVGFFIFDISLSPRVAPIYLDSGIELGAQKRRQLVFEKAYKIIADVLWGYRFEGFDRVIVSTPDEKKYLNKETLWKFRQGKLKIEDLK